MQKQLVVIAHNIRSLWNVGSIFRSADVFGVSHVYLTGYTGSPPRKEISKTALGADEWIPWSKHKEPLELMKRLSSEGFEIVSLEKTNKSALISEYKTEKPVCLVLGHEVLGVSEAILAASDAVLHIPMQGKKSSLNVSVATGIAFYHFRCCS